MRTKFSATIPRVWSLVFDLWPLVRQGKARLKSTFQSDFLSGWAIVRLFGLTNVDDPRCPL